MSTPHSHGDDGSFKPGPITRPQFIFALGEVIDDTYEVRGFLGGGGMGQVFEAYDRDLHRYVAIKAMFPDPESPSLEEIFLRATRQSDFAPLARQILDVVQVT